jgi:hypothetical protein
VPELDEVLARSAELEVSTLGGRHLAGSDGFIDGETGCRELLGELVDGDAERGKVFRLRGPEVLRIRTAELDGAPARRRLRLARYVERRRSSHAERIARLAEVEGQALRVEAGTRSVVDA